MNKFAFLAHPLNLDHFCEISKSWNLLTRFLSPYQKKMIMKRIKPYPLIHFQNVLSKTGDIIEGYVIVCPLTPDLLVGSDPKDVRKLILDACKLGEKLGAGIVGLGGFTSIVTNGGIDIVDDINIAVTSGNTFTSTLVIDSMVKAAKMSEKDPSKITVLIVGATGDIGSICSKHMASYFTNFVLVARDEQQLIRLREDILAVHPNISVRISTNVKNEINQADLILTATSALTTIINPSELKDGAILCDVSYPANINKGLASKNSKVIVYEGGLVKSGFLRKENKHEMKKVHYFNELNTLHGCIAETMLLTFEKNFENYSLGRGNISRQKIDEIREISLVHGFNNFVYSSGNKEYFDKDFKTLAKREFQNEF